LSKDAVKKRVQQARYNATICLKDTGGPLIERRRAKRFQVDWQVRVEGNINGGVSFVGSGVLRNISSGGALVSLPEGLPEGATMDVYIRLPLQGTKWMKYPAHVVRTERGVAVCAAISFDTPRPDFRPPLGAVS